MKNLTLLAAVSGLIVSSSLATGGQLRAGELSTDNFAEVQQLIKPQSGESLWRHIPWETNLNAARRKAAAEGKPLLIWAGGGSAPLGGC